MKFEESSLTRYLVKNLQPLTEADPGILAEYVAALLKKDKPIKELQKLCAEKLVEFLGQGTNSFITTLFEALEDGTILAPARSLDTTGQVEPSPSHITEDPVEVKTSALNPEVPGCASDPEEKEVSDDDDDDRNHKHRRRETRSQSFDKDVQGQLLRRTNRKRNKPYENGQVFFGNDPQSSENQKEYNPASSERDFSSRVDKRRPGLAPLSRTAYDLGIRSRDNQAFHADPGPHFDLSTSFGRLPPGRGRGRGSGPWNPHDLKFSSIDTLDFASQMPQQAPTHPSLFGGRGMQPFGMITGMPNGALETLHPLGLQGAFGPHINQSMSIGMARQRCRDFEERGFCLRGDMCPMEHGVNRIVVEDVQSLSQFNLPVSLPSAHLMGTPPGAGSLQMGSGPSNLQANSKSLLTKNNKHGIGDDGFDLNRVPSATPGAGEADLYDPDQPLWNNDNLSAPKVDDVEPLWNGDQSDHHSFRLSDNFEGEYPGRNITSAVGSQSTSSSVWGRIGNSGNKLDTEGNLDTSAASMGCLRNETKGQEKALSSVPGATRQRNGPKSTNSGSNQRRNETARNNGRTSQKALRTLFVNGIPLKTNKREALVSHFRKFGQIIDIYIPLNSEKAFIQFSKREEAEAALKAPDAVMGNRFIKLWWANRDSIADSGASIADTVSAAPQSVTTPVLAQPSDVDRRKESLSSAVPKVSTATSSDFSVSTAVVSPSVTHVPKVAPLPQKKLDNLELLKEEIRLKQEMLDKKRNDFRRQLDRLEKKAITIKGETAAEQVAKKPKLVANTDLVRTAAPNPTNSITSGSRSGAEKPLEKTHSGESIGSPSSKLSSNPVLHSPRSLKHPTRPSIPLGGLCLANRFKLDNRPTTFRVLPPLPAEFANVVALKEHFSTFGDISAIELEDLEDVSGATCSEPSVNSAARINFMTRRSAEMAFLNGKCWKGHNLNFSWLVVQSSSTTSRSGREISPTQTPKGNTDAEVMDGAATSESLLIEGDPPCSVPQVEALTGNEELNNSKGTADHTEFMDRLDVCHSSQTPSLSCQTLSPKADSPVVEDGIDMENVQ